MTSQKYKGYRIERHRRYRDGIFSEYDIYKLNDSDSVFPTKLLVGHAVSLKGAKDWINKEISK